MELWIWEGKFGFGKEIAYYPLTQLVLTMKKTLSNGIRFSITDMSPSTARIMPIIYQDRAGISLYDACSSTSHDGGVTPGPIPDPIVQQVIAKFSHFKTTCADFGVPTNNVHVLATEATRRAANSEAFRKIIHYVTGWEVKLLSKEEEGRLGAMGVASSSASTSGFVVDMGGGSAQITWMIAERGDVTTSSRGSFSFPYGAAALGKRLENTLSTQKERIEQEIAENFKQACEQLQVPSSFVEAAKTREGIDLYLCGGGFRGWGYMRMPSDYPIPIINGFRLPREKFYTHGLFLKSIANQTVECFGVSKRRASQLPAVDFLTGSLTEALPNIRNIQFCQGGVREGFLYDRLPPEIRAQNPLLVATSPYAPRSVNIIKNLLASALPGSPALLSSKRPPETFSDTLLTALSNLLFAHSNVNREIRPATALHSTTTGILAPVNSIAHVDRAMLALILAERWYGDLPKAEQEFQERLRKTISPQEVWWCQYLGRVGAVIGAVYPSGFVPEGKWRMQLFTQWKVEEKKRKGEVDLLDLIINLNDTDKLASEMMRESLQGVKEKIEKAGKQKNWIASPKGNGDPYGVHVSVNIISEQSMID